MSCRILLKNYAKLSINCSSVTNLLKKETAKWQTLVMASATSPTSRSQHTSSALGGEGLPAGSVVDYSQLVKGYSRYPAWLSDSQGTILSCHLQQVPWQHQIRCCYCTQPHGEGSGSTAGTQVAADSAEVQLSQREKLKRAVKEYGSTVIVFHVAISLASLGGFYLAVSSGIDMVGILKSMGVGETILQSKLATGTGTFVVAYAVHKVFAPVRIGITLTATPFIVRYLRSKGILKPPKAKA